jgi:hypothetical protein
MFRLNGSFLGLPTIGSNRSPPLHLQYDTVSPKHKKNTATFPFTAATSMRPPRAYPPHRFPTRRPSPAVAFPSGRRAPTLPRCCRAPIPRRSRPPVTRVACPAEPSQVLLAMVVVVLAWHRLRPRRLQLPSSGSPM